MKKITIILMSIILMSTFIFSQSVNTSFKIGLPFSSVHMLLGDRNVAGKIFTPTIGLSYFSLSFSDKYTEDGITDENDLAARFFIPRVGARILRGSNNPGFSASICLTVDVKASRRSVSILILLIPFSMAF